MIFGFLSNTFLYEYKEQYECEELRRGLESFIRPLLPSQSSNPSCALGLDPIYWNQLVSILFFPSSNLIGRYCTSKRV